MALTPGTRLGVYEVTAPIGEGGMGQVYRATDTKLKRQVAIKILPTELAADTDRLARFQREAEVLASLNHPNIAAIYGLEESTGGSALVMELVEGEDLSQRIACGAIPLDEALPIAKQIAEALEAAHEQGIVHRDLKPANIKVRSDGSVKVLDFGLAKAIEGAGGAGEAGRAALVNSPTITTPAMTMRGMILGTAAYMAPEQAKGKPVDRRADVWALGAVLYEMLTGRRAFEGEDTTDTIVAVVSQEPDWAALPVNTSASIRKLLRRCLEKDRKRRLTDAGAARLEIEDALTGPASREGLPTPDSRLPARSSPLAWMASLAAAAVLIAVMAMPVWRHLNESPPPEMRLEIRTPSTDAPFQFALSPDGRHIVFVASGDGTQRLWLRSLERTGSQPMAGTDGAAYPFWSADSRSIGFFANAKLSRVDIAGGSPQILADAPLGRGGTWNADGTILFSGASGVALSRITSAGGEPEAVTRLDPPRTLAHRFPQFLSDGRHFVFYAAGQPEASGIYLGSIEGRDARRLTVSDAAGAYLAPDSLVFIRQGTLVARRLDLARGELTGDAVTLADSIGIDGGISLGGFSVSAVGQVAYRSGSAGLQQLTWFDRTGKAIGVAGEPDADGLLHPELSPDGRRVALYRTVQNNPDIWLMDLVRGGVTRLTTDAATDTNPLWSPDGTRIVIQSNRKGAYNLYVKPSNGAGVEQLLLETPNTKAPQDWSTDGRFLLYYEANPKTGRDLWALEMTGTERKPRVVVNTTAEETLAQFSPDGRWVVYQTNESGRFEIVVQSFPDPTRKWPLSTGGGVAPRWRADGTEIYFIAPDSTMMAVPVTSSGSTLAAGTPIRLFATRIVFGGAVANNRAEYAVARDGRFLINQPVETTATPITLLLNWNAGRNR